MRRRFFLFLIFVFSLQFVVNEVKTFKRYESSFETLESFSISSGKWHSLLLSSNKELFAWGSWGDVSLESSMSTIEKIYPSNITEQLLLNDGDELSSVASGEQHSFVLTKNGDVFAFGCDSKGQLGNGGEIYYVGDLKYATQLVKEPIKITTQFNYLENEKIVKIKGGANFSLAISNKGRIFAADENNNGQLGLDDTTVNYKSSFVDITSMFDLANNDRIIDISCGSSHALAITLNGNLYVWGNNNFGQLGNNSNINLFKPTKLTIGNEKVIAIACGRFHSYILTSLNNLYGFGYNGEGQLADKQIILSSGNDKKEPFDMTKSFSLQPNEKITNIYSGSNYGIAMTNYHSIYSFGQNTSGQLGNKTNIATSTPINITKNISLSTNDYIVDLGLGEKHCIAISKRNEVYSWGDNGSGQLGENYSINYVFTPNTITKNFPPIIKLSQIGSVSYCKHYEVVVRSFYINDQEVTNLSYCWSTSNTTIPVETNFITVNNNVGINLAQEDGIYYLWIKAVSENNETFYKVSEGFYLDSTLPIIGASLLDSTKVNNQDIVDKNVKISVSDNNSGVYIMYKVDNETSYSLISADNYTFTNDGKYSVKAVDKASNESMVFEFIIDTINPSVIKINNDLIQSNVYNTKNKEVIIKASEIIGGYILLENDYITALEKEDSSFTIQLEKGENKIQLVDLSGKTSDVYTFNYDPVFYEDEEFMAILFSIIAAILIIFVVILYSLKSRRNIKKELTKSS